ncbi:MAG: hypothetical protein ACOX4D_01025 [Bacteroidales bacterium]
MKRFILFFTTLILLPVALQAQVTDPNDDSGIVYDSIKIVDGVLMKYFNLNGRTIIEIVEPNSFRNKSNDEEIIEIKSEEPRPDLDLEYCTYKGIPLKGDVKIVESNADFRVRFVRYSSSADIVVETASSVVNSDPCCTWKFVSSNADFTIKIVNSAPDLNVYVNDSNIDYYEKYKDY